MYTILRMTEDDFKDNERQAKMLSNRDDKPNEHEESEYHFSDDDVGYEIESDSPKSSASEGGGSASNALSRLTGSKRMMISLGVFLVLVFVVYKMVAPGSSAPSTDIVPQAAAPVETMSASSAPASTPAPAEQVAPVQETATQPVMSVAAGNQQPPSAAAPASAAPQEMAASPPQPASVQQPPQQVQQQIQQTQQAAPVEQKIIEQNPEVVASMPPVIPVQSNIPATSGQPPVVTSVTHTGTDAAIASMVSTNERLMGQLQADYTQRLNEYSSQTKDMQGQIQTLNSRVATMESQMNQIVQILTHGAPQGAAPSMAAPASAAPVPQAAVPQSQASDVKVNYSVQAIIPGRAWLRSENGETVTVAEGDSIKDLGRVTKIDPYDGVVEVNTGNKTVSISYGNSE